MNVFRTDGWVKTAQGPAVPGAQIYVCTQPANIAALPPTPLANIFSDPQGLVPITQPIITDGFGHYDFYAAAGVYTTIVGLGGLIQQVYPDQSIGGAGSSGGTALILETNGTPNGDQLLQNLIAGANVTLTDDDAGNITVSSTGGAVFTTPGGAYFWGPGIMGPLTGSGASNLAFSGNTVYAYKFLLQSQFSISKCSYIWTNNFFGGQTLSFAIYDANGNKVLDSGAFDLSLAADTVHTKSIVPVTLGPGIYYFAQAADASGLTGPSINLFASPTGPDMAKLGNAVSANLATSSQARAAGVMPNTLGTLTAVSDVTTISVAVPLFTS